MNSETTGRTYRFGPLDRSGWMLGLSATQCLVLAAGVLASGVLLQHRSSAPVVVLPLIVTAAVAFTGWEGRPAHEQIPPLARLSVMRLSRGHRWFADPVPDSGAAVPAGVDLPPFLAGLVIEDGPALCAGPSTPDGVGVVRDRAHRTVSATVRVRGQGFALLAPADQDRLVARWGEVLAALCTERSPVISVRVTEWAGPCGLPAFADFTEREDPGSAAPTRAYRELLAESSPSATGHEALVTITVGASGPSRRGRDGSGGTTVLIEQMRLLCSQLDAADLVVEGPLSPAETLEVVRRRCDPTACNGRPSASRSLAALAGLDTVVHGPMATSAEWAHARVDGAVHRSYWVAGWPRLDVPAGWPEPLLLHPGGARTFSLHCEPVPPSRSRRGVDRDATRLAVDGEQRSRAGFRVGARHRRAEAAVLEREAELVSGHAELAYCGFLTVSAASEAELVRSCADYEQAAALAGLELRALHGRHDLALVCSLPVGRGLRRRRTA